MAQYPLDLFSRNQVSAFSDGFRTEVIDDLLEKMGGVSTSHGCLPTEVRLKKGVKVGERLSMCIHGLNDLIIHIVLIELFAKSRK